MPRRGRRSTLSRMARDLHAGFRDPRRVPAAELVRFLETVDRLPGIRAIQRALRAALDLRRDTRVLDAGCGIGLETARLDARVTGLDRNPELLDVARSRSSGVDWVEGDIAALELPGGAFDAVRTERVLMYLPDLERGLDELLRVLRPGGRLALFELDYGATILPPGGPVVDRVLETLHASLPQPLAGRRIPGLLRARGLRDVTARVGAHVTAAGRSRSPRPPHRCATAPSSRG